MCGIICPNCGHEMGDLAGFCNQCGTSFPPLTDPAALQEQESHKDINCHPVGHRLQKSEINAKFCSSCGVKL